MKNQRRFSRILYRAPALLLGDDEKPQPCEVTDLSLKGCLLQLPQGFEPKPELLYELQIPLHAGSEIKMQIMLVHVRGDQAGFQCRYIDLDSISTLRRLIELNLGHYRQLERDLNALCQDGED